MTRPTINPAGDNTSLRPAPRQTKTTSTGGNIFLFLLIIALGIVAVWQYLQLDAYRLSNERRNLVYEVNLNRILDGLKITGKSFDEIGQERRTRSDFIDDEIRKLWAVANKRNKGNIALLQKSITRLDAENAQQSDDFFKKINAVLAQTKANTKSITGLGEITANNTTTLTDNLLTIRSEAEADRNELRLLVVENSKLISKVQSLDRVNEHIAKMQKSVDSVNAQRRSSNSRIIELRQEVTLLKARLNAIENSQPFPSVNVAQ